MAELMYSVVAADDRHVKLAWSDGLIADIFAQDGTGKHTRACFRGAKAEAEVLHALHEAMPVMAAVVEVGAKDAEWKPRPGKCNCGCKTELQADRILRYNGKPVDIRFWRTSHPMQPA